MYHSRVENKTKLLAGILLSLFILCCPVDVAEAAKKQKEEPVENLPVTIYADYVHYEESSGDLYAEGNVRVIQGGQVMLAQRIDGNVKTGDIWTRVKTEFREPATQTKFFSDKIDYNYNSKTGQADNVTGKVRKENMQADKVDIYPDRMQGHNAMMTRCTAKGTKCQHTVARRVDIWPAPVNKLIAYDAKVYVLGMQIAHRTRYVTSLGERDNQIPRIGYDNDYGYYVAQNYSFPIDYKTTVGVNMLAGTEIGGRSIGWANHQETNFRIRYSYGYTEDSDNHWIKKENNIRADYYYKRLFGLPWKYRLWFERGLWKDDKKQSWHKDIGIYFSRDPIYLSRGKSIWFNLGTGYQVVEESYRNTRQDIYRYDIGLTKRISPKWMVNGVYSNSSSTTTLFNYNAINVAESFSYTITWRPDNKNAFMFYQQRDVANDRVYMNKASYVRNLHCWDLYILYERERRVGQPHDNKFRWEMHLAI